MLLSTQASNVNLTIGSLVWVEDPEVAWMDVEVVVVNDEEFEINCTSGKTVMTSNLECATVDTPVCDALIKMHERKCLHLPVVDEGGNMVAVVDVADITRAVVAYVKMTDGSSGITDALGDEPTGSMIQLFWHSALVNKDEGFRSVASGGEKMRSLFFPSSNLSIT